jgi:hypothetical protein
VAKVADVADRPEGAPWRPPGLDQAPPELQAAFANGELAYVVVDDLEPGVAGLVVSRWPRVDELGRIRFELERDARVAVDVATLQELLTQRVPVVPGSARATEELLRTRPLLVGDVFAARLVSVPEGEVDTPTDARGWFATPIVDVSVEAREAAQAQYYAAVAGVLTETEIDEIVEEFRGDEAPGPEAAA